MVSGLGFRGALFGGLYRSFIGIMEENMEATIKGFGLRASQN